MPAAIAMEYLRRLGVTTGLPNEPTVPGIKIPGYNMDRAYGSRD